MAVRVAMFGAGNSWRKKFKSEYEKHGIPFYDILKNSKNIMKYIEYPVIVCPVSGEDYGFDAIAQVDFFISKLTEMPGGYGRDVCFFIERKLDEKLKNTFLRRLSDHARARVVHTLKKVITNKKVNVNANIHLIDSMDELLDFSIRLANYR
ncbi:MAG: hypothetical protein V4439_02395 [Patescibacteria group bacterium]